MSFAWCANSIRTCGTRRPIWEGRWIHLPCGHIYREIQDLWGWRVRERNEEGKINFSPIATCRFSVVLFITQLLNVYLGNLLRVTFPKGQNSIDGKDQEGILWGKCLAYKWDLIKIICRLHCCKLSMVEHPVAWLFSPSCDWSLSTSRHPCKSGRTYSHFLNVLDAEWIGFM